METVMQWSITLGRIAGTAVRIHLTFLILLAWIGISDYLSGGPAAAWTSLAFLVLVFACVLAHEFGHILTARRFGVKTPEVVLLPIGGVANMERIPEDPGQEFLVAVAGPLVNVVIAAAIMLGTGLTFEALGNLDPAAPNLVGRLALANVALVIFNLVPAFPMDGGRVLRALLAMKLGHRRATGIAARLGQVFAMLFVFAGLFYSPMLIFVGMFIYIAAVSEQQSNEFRWFAQGLTVADALEKPARLLASDARLSDAVDVLLATSQHDFPVIDPGGLPAGMLDRDDLLAALKENGPEAAIASVMRKPAAVRNDQALEQALAAMQADRARSRIVVDGEGRAIGLLTMENIAEMMMIHAVRPEWEFAERGGATSRRASQ